MDASTTATFGFLKETYGNKIKSTKNDIMVLQCGKGCSLTGSINIAKNFQRENNTVMSLEDRMSVEQWLDFSGEITGSENAGDRERIGIVVKDLDTFLKDRVYFVGATSTVADVFLYHSFFPVFERMSFQEKEKLINLSRWFNLIQQDVKARQSLRPITFLRTMIYSNIGH